MGPEEVAFLKPLIPKWRNTASDKRGRARWLDTTVKQFSTKFNITQGSQTVLRHQVRHWFYNHGTDKGAPPPVAPAPTIDLSSKQPRKIVPLTLSQAYACLFCNKGSPLHEEILDAWRRYREADDAILEKYRHILPAEHKPNMPFVGFQQILLRDCVSRATKDELEDLQQFIDERFEAETELRERPWTALKVTEAQSEADLEREYLIQQIDNLSSTLDAACKEVKRVTNFNSFVIYGGPSPRGSGGLQIWHVGSGRSIMTGQSFQEFLGPLWGVLKDKYGEWLNTTYSHEELLRKEQSASEPSPTPPASPSNRTPRPSEVPDPGLASYTSSSPKRTSQLSSKHVSRSSSNHSSPSRSNRFSPSRSNRSSPSRSPSRSSPSRSSPSRSSPSRSPSRSSPSRSPSRSSPSHSSPSRSPSRSNRESPSPSDHAAPLRGSDRELMSSDTSPSPSHARRSPTPTPRQPPPISRTQTDWSPTHEPVWVIGPQHRGYLRAAVQFLTGVPGGPEWENLLMKYILFESLSSSRSGACKMPTQPRPDELGWWFKWGRLYDPKHLPEIESIEVFEEQWVVWWSAAQPGWRETESWPFEQVDATGRNWGKLPDGGKDGLFLVMISLGWWIHARDPSEDSALDDAIVDVTWVLDNLIHFLSVDITTGSEPPSDTLSPTPRKRNKQPIKIGPPRKRARS